MTMRFRAGVYDREIIDEVMVGDPYRLRKRVFAPSPVIVDIGAHIGSFTVFAKQLHPDATIVAVEMDDENHALLVENTAGLPGVTIVHAAMVGATAPLGYCRGKTNSGGTHVTWVKYPDTLPLPETLTLAQLAARFGLEHVDLLKLDCEGCEHTILRQAVSDGSIERVKCIVAEYHAFFDETLAGLLDTLARGRFCSTTEPLGETSGYIFCERGPRA